MRPLKSFEDIVKTHDLFCRLVNRHIPFDMTYLYAYERFTLKFSDADLRLLVGYIRSCKAKGRPARELTMRSLITGPNALTWAAEDLAEARIMKRMPAPTPRDAILRSTHRPAPEQDRVRSVAQVLEHEKMAKMIAEWKAQL